MLDQLGACPLILTFNILIIYFTPLSHLKKLKEILCFYLYFLFFIILPFTVVYIFIYIFGYFKTQF